MAPHVTSDSRTEMVYAHHMIHPRGVPRTGCADGCGLEHHGFVRRYVSPQNFARLPPWPTRQPPTPPAAVSAPAARSSTPPCARRRGRLPAGHHRRHRRPRRCRQADDLPLVALEGGRPAGRVSPSTAEEAHAAGAGLRLPDTGDLAADLKVGAAGRPLDEMNDPRLRGCPRARSPRRPAIERRGSARTFVSQAARAPAPACTRAGCGRRRRRARWPGHRPADRPELC